MQLYHQSRPPPGRCARSACPRRSCLLPGPRPCWGPRSAACPTPGEGGAGKAKTGQHRQGEWDRWRATGMSSCRPRMIFTGLKVCLCWKVVKGCPCHQVAAQPAKRTCRRHSCRVDSAATAAAAVATAAAAIATASHACRTATHACRLTETEMLLYSLLALSKLCCMTALASTVVPSGSSAIWCCRSVDLKASTSLLHEREARQTTSVTK